MASPRRHTDDWVLQRFCNKPPKSQPHILSPCLWTLLLFLLMGQGASEKDSASTVVKGILGGSVILSLNISVDAEVERITWSGPKDTIALAFPSGEILFLDKSYQGRIDIPENNSLSINKLTLKDAGSYKARINQKGSEDINERFILHIYEQLQEPQVTIQSVNMSENASCIITLVCSAEGAGGDVQYKWTSRDPRASESWGDPTLIVSWLPCDADLPYTCTAKNPVSQSSSYPVHVSQFCTDLGASRGGSMGETVLGVLGESITLSLALLDSQHVDNVVWMFNTSIISKEWRGEGIANQLTEFKNPDQSTVWVSSQDYSLKIIQLKMEHAGLYHAYMCSNARIASVKHINLHIYQRLKKPKVTRSLGLTKDGICKISLTCSVEDSGHNVTYGWAPLPKGAVISQGGAHLSISWISGEKHPNFTCTASNPVSNSSRQFLSRDLCPGPERSTEFWIGLSLVVLFILLGFGISGWCFWKQKRRCSAAAFSSSQAETSVDTPGNVSPMTQAMGSQATWKLQNMATQSVICTCDQQHEYPQELVRNSPLLAAYHTPCFPKGVRSWTLSLRLPGMPPTAALTAMEQLRRMRRRQGCTSPSMEETRCVTRALGRTPDLTRTLRAKQSMISSLQITWHQHLWLKGKRCTHKCSLTCRERLQFLRRKRIQPQSTALYRNLRRLCHHHNRMTLSLLKYLPMKMSPEKKGNYLPQ
ncbi:T-lymphocyte surface antigen Ly-9-like isoform X2 [Odocoileus virginianus]|uniref:T-lymphocyte surface antigen Ly-9-like isoform X2 n=1 Tax=Odocoileus virginianus TaxID=9874 RepID=A0ABM4I7E1_ODOVR